MGLEGVGKTVSLYQLKLGEAIDSVPTVGVIEENIKYHKMVFEIVEIGGHEMLQKLWGQYLSTADAVLWVIDMSKKALLAQSAAELRRVEQILKVTEKPVLLGVLLNKADLATLTPRAVSEQLKLEQLKFKKKYVQQLSALNGANELWVMIDWIYSHLPKLKEH
uniref:Uncharacterized protein n=1 Tax=Arcella intermedia TaxID=1963864 RepID=A0A6B2LKC3_9EUKA